LLFISELLDTAACPYYTLLIDNMYIVLHHCTHYHCREIIKPTAKYSTLSSNGRSSSAVASNNRALMQQQQQQQQPAVAMDTALFPNGSSSAARRPLARTQKQQQQQPVSAGMQLVAAHQAVVTDMLALVRQEIALVHGTGEQYNTMQILTFYC
jgi:hypothetical protein